MTRARAYGLTLVLLLVGAVLLLWSATRVWVTATSATTGLPGVGVALTGGQVLPVVSGVGLLLLAGIAGVIATRGLVRVIVGLVLLVASAVALEATIAFGRGGMSAAVEAVTSVTGGTAAQVSASGWWWLALAGALAGLVASGLTVALGHHWPSLGSRYQRDKGGSAAANTPAQMWDAMDRGEDPTAGPEVSQ